MSAAPAQQRIEKVMALSPREFVKCISALLPPGSDGAGLQTAIPLEAGRVTIAYEALPSVRLGRSLELPRARIVLTFKNAGDAERKAFLTRFDVAFQRGGG